MAQAGTGKQLQLGSAVSVHAAVVIQVIMGQIGVNRGLEFDAIDPALHQGVGGDFHAHRTDSLVAPLRQLSLQ